MTNQPRGAVQQRVCGVEGSAAEGRSSSKFGKRGGPTDCAASGVDGLTAEASIAGCLSARASRTRTRLCKLLSSELTDPGMLRESLVSFQTPCLVLSCRADALRPQRLVKWLIGPARLALHLLCLLLHLYVSISRATERLTHFLGWVSDGSLM